MNLSRIAVVGLASRILRRNDGSLYGASRLSLNYVKLEEGGHPFTCLLDNYKEIGRRIGYSNRKTLPFESLRIT
jgi:hypothetical protein